MKKLLFATVCLLVSMTVWSQIAVVRTLPAKGANPIDPDWSGPSPSLERRDTGRTQIDGRVALGGTAGILDADAWTYGVFLDGSLSLIQVIGPGALSVSSDVLRKQRTLGLTERYNGTLSFDSNRFGIGIESAYDSERNAQSETTSMLFALTHQLSVIETLPISLQAEYGAEQKMEENASEKDMQEWLINLSAGGTVGAIGLDLAASYTSEEDFLELTHGYQAAGSLAVAVPLTSSLNILASLAPAVSSGTLDITKLDSRIGIEFVPIDDVNISLSGGRNDTWVDAHSSSWTLGAAADMILSSELSASAGYAISLHSAQPELHHQVDGGMQWTPESSSLGLVLGSLSVSATLAEELQMNAISDVSLTPATGLELSSSYGFSYVEEPDDGTSMTHDAAASFTHNLQDLMSYDLGAVIAYSDSQTQTMLGQQYDASLNINPLIKGSRYPFSISELVAIEADEGTASSLTASAQVPALKSTLVSYSFTWDRAFQDSGQSDAYRHAAAVIVDLFQNRLVASADYGFVHGDLGIRHDFRTAISFPVSSWLGIQVESELSRFEDQSGLRRPFLISIASTYEF